ncbi:hypothetical protein BBJ28_00024177 [Nothophytophthora sp. Chile5]|nr:hypothetical protein BBJ28_00024177 [Nothophytophthora sp. Chile5]
MADTTPAIIAEAVVVVVPTLDVLPEDDAGVLSLLEAASFVELEVKPVPAIDAELETGHSMEAQSDASEVWFASPGWEIPSLQRALLSSRSHSQHGSPNS